MYPVLSTVPDPVSLCVCEGVAFILLCAPCVLGLCPIMHTPALVPTCAVVWFFCAAMLSPGALLVMESLRAQLGPAGTGALGGQRGLLETAF